MSWAEVQRWSACGGAVALLGGCLSYSSSTEQGPPPPAYAQSYCREVPATAVIEGRTQTLYGRACQQPDGSWRLVP
jgi:hypothetical protein